MPARSSRETRSWTTASPAGAGASPRPVPGGGRNSTADASGTRMGALSETVGATGRVSTDDDHQGCRVTPRLDDLTRARAPTTFAILCRIVVRLTPAVAGPPRP